jgi:hypothetical protein
LSALAGAERDDAADWIVWGDAHGDSIPWHHFDSKATHAAAELRKHFVPGIALNAIEPAAVNRYYGALHVNQIVLAQLLEVLSQTTIMPHS